jgi:hypothetical protein
MFKKEFELLCSKTKEKIGEKKFRSTNSQALCGHIRVAIRLRFLCGGSYLDLVGRAYGVDAVSSVYEYFHTFIDWIDETFYPWRASVPLGAACYTSHNQINAGLNFN